MSSRSSSATRPTTRSSARDLAKTGTETIYSPSGFDQIDGLPAQTWYHWGELWLAAAAISIFGMAPLDARHFVVLPLPAAGGRD